MKASLGHLKELVPRKLLFHPTATDCQGCVNIYFLTRATASIINIAGKKKTKPNTDEKNIHMVMVMMMVVMIMIEMWEH